MKTFIVQGEQNDMTVRAENKTDAEDQFLDMFPDEKVLFIDEVEDDECPNPYEVGCPPADPVIPTKTGFNLKTPIYDIEIEFRFIDFDNEEVDSSDLLDPVEGNPGAYTGQKTDGHCVVILPPDFSMKLAVHEIVHAASFVLTACGIRYNNDHHEQLAYLVDYIYGEFEKAIK